MVRAGVRLGLVEEYEVTAVEANDGQWGGVGNGPVPNHVYRSNQREVRKTVRSLLPAHEHDIRFAYGLRVPADRLGPRPIVRVAQALAPVAQRLAPRQGDEFAFVIAERPAAVLAARRLNGDRPPARRNFPSFRQHFGRPDPGEYGATRGVLASVLMMLSDGATHVGVASDHVIESFRNDLWPGYKTSAGMPPSCSAQIPMWRTRSRPGVTVWPMVEWEADDALGAAAAVAAADPRVEQVRDLHTGQGPRPVRDAAPGWCSSTGARREVDEAGVDDKFGVPPASIPDYLALVGDTADGFPGWRAGAPSRAATVLARSATSRRSQPRPASGTLPGLRAGRRSWP